MDWSETARYAALGAAAALLLSGGVYATTSFASPPINARAGDIYSGDFDYVPKIARDEQATDEDDATVTEVPGAPGSKPANDTSDPSNTPAPAQPQPTPAPQPVSQQPPADPQEGAEPVPAEEPENDGGGSADAPAQEPENEDNDAEPGPADLPTDDDDGDEPEEPGGPPIPPGPGTIKAVNPCILVDCDPDPVIDTIQAVDICKLIDCLGPDPAPTPKPGLLGAAQIAPRD